MTVVIALPAAACSGLGGDRHLDDVPLDELHAVVVAEDARLRHAVVVLHVEAVPDELAQVQAKVPRATCA